MIKTKKSGQITSLLYYKAEPKANVVTISFNILVGSRKNSKCYWDFQN